MVQSPADEPGDSPDQAPDQERGPLRRCIVTGQVGPKDNMVRFVIGPDGTVVPDIDERLPGRGLWLSAARDMINTACAKNLFSKAARQRVQVPDGLADEIERQLARKCRDLLGMAKRSGRLVAGFEKVKSGLKGGQLGLVFEASDGADGGRGRLRGLAAERPVIGVLTRAEMAQALGREDAVHVLVSAGRLAKSLQRETGRLAGLRGGAAKCKRTD